MTCRTIALRSRLSPTPGVCLGLMLLAGVMTACGSRVPPQSTLESHVQEFTGPNALNCGRLGKTAIDQEMETALACGLNASSRGIAFSIVREYQGIDSFVAEGLVAKAAGPVFKFVYDGGLPCGGPGPCPDTFTTAVCRSPRIGKESYGSIFACAQ